MPQYWGGPYRFRTWLRGYLPWSFIDAGIAAKGLDCEVKAGRHEWYKKDEKRSACYHCVVEKDGDLWKQTNI